MKSKKFIKKQACRLELMTNASHSFEKVLQILVNILIKRQVVVGMVAYRENKL